MWTHCNSHDALGHLVLQQGICCQARSQLASHSPPTCTEAALSLRQSLFILQGGAERRLARRLAGGHQVWGSESSSWRPRAGFSPHLHAAPLSMMWKMSCCLWPFCSVFINGTGRRSKNWLQHHLHADVVGCCWGWNEAQVETRAIKVSSEKSHHAASLWWKSDFTMNQPLMLTVIRPSWSHWMSWCIQFPVLCPHSVSELHPSTKICCLFTKLKPVSACEETRIYSSWQSDAFISHLIQEQLFVMTSQSLVTTWHIQTQSLSDSRVDITQHCGPSAGLNRWLLGDFSISSSTLISALVSGTTK